MKEDTMHYTSKREWRRHLRKRKPKRQGSRHQAGKNLDLTRVKSKFIFNLTKRQVVCFGLGALVGVPMFFLTKDTIGPSMAALVMIAVMLPFFMFAMYERHGMPLEVLISHYIQARYIRPRKRVYQTENFYATIDQNIRNRREVKKILHGKA